jgi:site-specific recombinase XerD
VQRIGDPDEMAGEPYAAATSPHGMHRQPSNPDTWVVPVAPSDEQDDGAGGHASPSAWRQALPRWLATLDSKRTRREYEKAVLYFFQAPGVPEALSDLTFDLLLAYRGSLALRAERRTTRAAQSGSSGRPSRPSNARPTINEPRSAPNSAQAADAVGQGGKGPPPLAPATVNVRLTALRQFLAHCSLWTLVPQLSPERIRGALRRLSIERRRPYQILAEPEWASFLNAARAPAIAIREAGQRTLIGTRGHPAAESPANAPTAIRSRDTDRSDRQVSVWGTPRAIRRRMADQQTTDDSDPGANGAVADSTRAEPPTTLVDTMRPAQTRQAIPGSVRSKAGLTGARTAHRDHALLALALATGLRAIELCGLDLGDLAREWHAGREEWWLVVPDAKTKGQRGGRTLPLAASVVHTIMEYVQLTGRRWERASDRDTPLFLSRRTSPATKSEQGEAPLAGGRLSPEQVRRIVDRVETQWVASGYLSERGTAPEGAGTHTATSHGSEGRAISPHSLRHSTAVALLEGNDRSGRAPASVEHVRGWLGHFDIRTTQGYLAHLDARRHRRPFALQPVDGEVTRHDDLTEDSRDPEPAE